MNYEDKKWLKHQILYKLKCGRLNPDGVYSCIPSIQEYAEWMIKKLRLNAPEAPPTSSTSLSQEPTAIRNSWVATLDSPPIHPMDEIISKRIEVTYKPSHSSLPIAIPHLHEKKSTHSRQRHAQRNQWHNEVLPCLI